MRFGVRDHAQLNIPLLPKVAQVMHYPNLPVLEPKKKGEKMPELKSALLFALGL
jgi:hypothetical protein